MNAVSRRRRSANNVACLVGGLLLAAGTIDAADAVPLKGSGPSHLAVGYGTAWVGMGDGRLRPVDAESRRVGRALWLGGGRRGEGFSVKDIATGFGSVWVTTGRAVLHTIDPQTHNVREIYRVGGGGWTPTLVEVGVGAVWVGDYERNQIFRVDPRSRKINRWYAVDGRLVRLAAGPSGVWALTAPGSGPLTGPEGRRLLVRVDDGSRKPLLSVSCDGALAVGSRWIWLSDACKRTVTRLDPHAGTSTTVDVDGEPWSIALGGGAAWVSTGTGLERIDTESAEATLVSPRPNTLARYDGGAVWFIDCWGCARASLRTVDTSGQEVGRPIRISP